MIEIENNHINIFNYELNSHKTFENSLKVYSSVSHSYTYQAFFFNEKEKKLIIPGGYSVTRLKKYFPDEEINYNVSNNYNYKKISFKLKFPARSSLQNKALSFLSNNKDSMQKFLCLETGGGKTYCAINYINHIKKLPLILVDQESLALQWKKQFMFFTDIKEEEFFYISGKKSLETLLKKTKKELNKIKVFIGVHRTLKNFIEEDEKNIKDLFDKLQIGIKIFDEAHVEYKNIFLIDSLTNTESLYLTATPKRSDQQENKLYQNMFFDVPKFFGNLENYHNVIIINYDSNPTKVDEAKMQTQYGFSATRWSNYILQDEKIDTFIEGIKYILQSFTSKKEKEKISVMCSSIKLCKKVKEEIEKFVPKEYLVGIFNSSVKNKEEELKKDIIVTTERSFGKALDIKGLSILINTVPLSSKPFLIQITGRLRKLEGKEVYLVDYYDKGFSSQRNQLNNRKQVYKKICKKIYTLK